MKQFIQNYKSTLILLVAIVIGGVAGCFLGEKAAVLKPFGDVFLNLMFIIIVPLIFLTISSSIANMDKPKRMGKIMIAIVSVFLITSLVSVFVGIAMLYMIPN